MSNVTGAKTGYVGYVAGTCERACGIHFTGDWGKELILNEKDAQEALEEQKQMFELNCKICEKCGKCADSRTKISHFKGTETVLSNEGTKRILKTSEYKRR